MISSCLLPIVKHEYIEVLISANNATTRLSLPDIANLRSVHLRSLQVYTDQNYSPGVTGTAVIGALDIQQAWLTLQLFNGKEFTHQIPMQNLIATGGGLNFNFRDFTGQKVNWPKSYIDFSPPLVAVANDRVVPFSVFYQANEAIEQSDKTFEFAKNMV